MLAKERSETEQLQAYKSKSGPRQIAWARLKGAPTQYTWLEALPE